MLFTNGMLHSMVVVEATVVVVAVAVCDRKHMVDGDVVEHELTPESWLIT